MKVDSFTGENQPFSICQRAKITFTESPAIQRASTSDFFYYYVGHWFRSPPLQRTTFPFERPQSALIRVDYSSVRDLSSLVLL